MADICVEKLSQLARIHLTPEESKKLEAEFEGILGYISKLNEAPVKASEGIVNLWGSTNALREDGEPDEPGMYTKELLAEVPSLDGDRIKVKKIL